MVKISVSSLYETIIKSEIRISKYETNSNPLNSNDPNRHYRATENNRVISVIETFEFIICFGFRISDFEFSVLRTDPAPAQHLIPLIKNRPLTGGYGSLGLPKADDGRIPLTGNDSCRHFLTTVAHADVQFLR